jgi:hypothetical protein
MGALTENHKCPRGRLRRAGDLLSTIAIGSVLGALVTFALEERPAVALVVAASALGAVLVGAVRQAIGPRV